MNILRRLSGIASNFLLEISNCLDETIRFIILMYDFEKNSPKEEKDIPSAVNGVEKIIESYKGFDPVPFSFPSHIGHMDIEVIEVESKDLIKINTKIEDRTIVNSKTGEKKVIFMDGPAIVTILNRRLDDINSTMIIGMRECFSFIREVKFQFGMNLPEELAEEVLSGIVVRIMKETNWTFEQVLLSILMRDIIGPTIIEPLSKSNDSLQDTIRLYYTSGNVCRWAIIPYHSPSVVIGDLIGPGDDGFPEDQIDL